MNGVLVDVPIIANVTTAYVEFSGPGIVPEPSTAMAAFVGLVYCLAYSRSPSRLGPQMR